MLNISASLFIAAFIFGSIGLFLFQVGRKRQNVKVMITGIVLMGYSYFTPTAFTTWAIGIALSLIAYHFWNN